MLRPVRRHLLAGLAGLALLGLPALAGCGSDRPAGEIVGGRLPDAAVAREAEEQHGARREIERRAGGMRPEDAKRILFGDLHVHTTYSIDAFLMSLPIMAGEGAHPPADACDFARYCAQLDFFSLNDHAEAITPAHWQATKQSLRECNARAGDASDPDLVAFVGFEWTQVGATPETHYGHKNVMFPGLDESELPARPITSLPDQGDMPLFQGLDRIGRARFIDPLGWNEYMDFLWLADALADMTTCPAGVDTRELPPDCRENAGTPRVLFEKLAQWGFPTLVIPHGTTWGFYTPPGTSMDKALTRQQHDPERQSLIEIHSGHGNSEEYRAWREVLIGEDGSRTCPEPTADYLPCCWQAGEIMRARCGDLPPAECEARVQEARRIALDANVSSHLLFPDTTAEDWLDCGQCRDCFKPALSMRPLESVQYTMALSNFDEPGSDGSPLRFRYGFIASSDNHKARPGTGYKQYERRRMTEASGARSESIYQRLRRQLADVVPEDADPMRAWDPPDDVQGLLALDVERVASFLYPGGLVAVHSEGRARGQIWDALQRKEVYGTSGPRILLWFDLLNGPQGPLPMGSAASLAWTPRFEVRAIGAHAQRKGCPEYAEEALGAERLESLCRGECYHPSDVRQPIAAIEVVRIRPQREPGEAVGPLIEDPWRRFECRPDPNGCVVSFEDPEFVDGGRDALYYVRALQRETPAVNGANLRAELDAQGNVKDTTPCYGDFRTDFEDDCLAPVQERAWSSPIFLDQPRGAASAKR
jgi:hypothetical protein